MNLKKAASSATLCAMLLLVLGGVNSDYVIEPDNSSGSFRVLAYNIHHGEGMDEKLDLDRIAKLIRELDPDLVALQEIDSVVTRTGGVDQAKMLAELTNMDYAFSRFMPYQGGAYGMAVLSKWPIAESKSLRLPEGPEPRTSLSVTVRDPDSEKTMRFVGIHFYMTEEERLAQAIATEELLGDRSIPTILAGDFNSLPESSVMVHLAQSWDIVKKTDDTFTFPSYDPAREIDYVLVAPANVFTVLDEFLVDEPVFSDHRPYVVDLEWK